MASLVELFKNLFPQSNKKKQYITVSEAKLGQMVEVVFRDPRDLGIQVPGQLTCTRFNPDEFENRVVKGFVKHKGTHEAHPFGKYITIESRKLDRERQFLLMDYEIESMRLID